MENEGLIEESPYWEEDPENYYVPQGLNLNGTAINDDMESITNDYEENDYDTTLTSSSYDYEPTSEDWADYGSYLDTHNYFAEYTPDMGIPPNNIDFTTRVWSFEGTNYLFYVPDLEEPSLYSYRQTYTQFLHLHPEVLDQLTIVYANS